MKKDCPQTEPGPQVNQRWQQQVLAMLWVLWAFALLVVYYRQVWYTLGPRSEPLPEPNTLRNALIALPGIGLLLLMVRVLPGQRLNRYSGNLFKKGAKPAIGWGTLFVGSIGLVILVASSPISRRLPALEEALLRAFWGILGAGWVLLAAQILGWALFRFLHWRFADRREAVLYESSIGLGLLAYLSLGLAGLGLYYTTNVQILIGMVVVGGGAGYGYLSRFSQSSPPSQPPATIAPQLKGDRSWQTITCLALLIALIGALAPETEYDALWYHLGLPKIWLEQGYLVDQRADYISLYPMTWELIFGAGLALGGQVAAKLLHFATLPLTGLLVHQLARRFVPRASPWLAVALFVTVPIVLWEATTTYIDLALALHVGLVIYGLFRYREEPRWQWLVLAALNLGLALATKHLALFVLALASAGLFLHLWHRERNFKRVVLPVAVLIGLSLLLPLPWYIRSWLASGNPVFPELFEIFGASPDRWDGITESGLSRFLSTFGRPRTPLNLLTLPWDMTVNAALYGGTLGPLLLLLLPPLVWWRRWSRMTPWLLGFVGLYFALWASPISSYQMRFLLPIAPLLAVLAAESTTLLIEALRVLTRDAQGILLTGLTILLSLNLPPFIPFHEGNRMQWEGWLSHIMGEIPLSVVIGKESQEQYLERTVASYKAWRFINASLPKDAYILSFSGGDHFYSDRHRLWIYTALARPGVGGATLGEEKQAFQYLTQLGISHILLDKRELPALVKDGVAIVQPNGVNQWYALEYEDNHFALYRIKR